jgi:membrane protease YdiL (CAAX protease family)
MVTMEPEPPIGRTTVIRLTLLQTGVFLAVALSYAAMTGSPGAVGLTLTGWPTSVVAGILLFLGVAPFLLLPRRMGISNQLEETLATRLRVRDILYLNVLVSCAEELFFRGFLLRVVGIIPSAIVFGAMHYVGYASFLEVGYALSIGLVLGYLHKVYIPNIIFPITFHFLANVFSLLLTRRWASERTPEGFETGLGVSKGEE